MKSVFTLSFLITLFLTAGTALAYDCYEQTPPPQVVQVQSYSCSLCKTKQYQKPQYKCKQRQSCSTCSQCNKCNKYKKCNKYNSCSIRKPSCSKKACQQKYQCQTTYTKKTERIATTQCKLCGNYYLKGVKHYCKKKQCNTCGQQYRQGVPHNCGKVRYKSCEVSYYPTRTRVPQQDCFQQRTPQYKGGSKQVAKYCNLNVTRQESRETMETRWNAWVSRNQY